VEKRLLKGLLRQYESDVRPSAFPVFSSTDDLSCWSVWNFFHTYLESGGGRLRPIGWDCLKKLKDHPNYKSIPTIMYSTSSAKKDIDMAYKLGAQLFLTKPDDFRELSKILQIVASSSQEFLVSHLMGFESVKLTRQKFS